MELRQLLIDHFAGRPEAVAAYLFGSQASGKATRRSDVDVAVLLDEEFDLAADPFYRLDQAAALQASLGRAVDLVLLNQAPLLLRYQVLRYGQLIFERDHRQRVDFEVHSRMLYFDFRPILDALHARQAQRIKEGTFAARYIGRTDPLDDARRALERLESLEPDHA